MRAAAPRSCRGNGFLAIAVAGSLACGRAPATTAPTPIDSNAPRVGASFGTIGIEYVSANLPPGSTIDGCGPTIAGCAGRLRLTFRMRAAPGSTVVLTDAWLHGVNKIACFMAVGPPFRLTETGTGLVELLFDRVDAKCVLPSEITNLDVDVSGSDGAVGRQEFGVRYRFSP